MILAPIGEDIWVVDGPAVPFLATSTSCLVHVRECEHGDRTVGRIAAAVAVLKVIDVGLVELDQPVATYWPEFGD